MDVSSSCSLPAGASSSSSTPSTLPGSDALDAASGDELFDGFRKQEVVQLLQQVLNDMGYGASQAALENESGVRIEPNVLPPRRLLALLWQAVQHQQLRGLCHHVDDVHWQSPVTLFSDCVCEPTPLPTHCVARLGLHTDEVWLAIASHDSRYIASSSGDKTVILWECCPLMQFKVSHVLRGHSHLCTQIAWSHDDRYLLTASSDRTVRLWASDGDCIRVFTKHSDSVTGICWLPNPEHFLSGGFDRLIFMWNIDGSEIRRWEIASRVQDIGITHDGSRMLVVNSDRNLKVIDIMAQREICALPESEPVTSVCVSQIRDEVLVNVAQQVTSSQQRPVIRLWSFKNHCVMQQYFGHSQCRFVVRSCFGGAHEEFVFSGSEDAQVYIWQKHYGSLLHRLYGHTAVVNSVCWANSPSGAWLITAADDHTIRVWSSIETDFFDLRPDETAPVPFVGNPQPEEDVWDNLAPTESEQEDEGEEEDNVDAADEEDSEVDRQAIEDLGAMLAGGLDSGSSHPQSDD
jgi:WD40 repeat protein